jgi:hypothetical protein
MPRLAWAAVAASLSGCCLFQPKPPQTIDDKGMTIDTVLEQVRAQINSARQKECNEIKTAAKNKDKTQPANVQKLNVYLESIELQLALKRDTENGGIVKVDLPAIGQLGPSAEYDHKITMSTENTLTVKFAGLQPKAGARADPCDPNTTIQGGQPAVGQ